MKVKIILPEQSRPLNHRSLQYVAERQLAIEHHVPPMTCHVLNSGLLPKFKGPKLGLSFLHVYTLREVSGSLLKEFVCSGVKLTA